MTRSGLCSTAGSDRRYGRRFLTALREKGETADELEGAVQAVRERMTPWECGISREFSGRHVRNRRRRRWHAQYLDGGGDRRRGLRRSGRQAWQSCGDEPRRQLGRAGRPGRRSRRRARSSHGAAWPSSHSLSCSPRGITPAWRGLRQCGAGFRFGRFLTWSARSAIPRARRTSSLACQMPSTHGFWPRSSHVKHHIRRAVVVTGSDGLDEITLDGPTIVRLVEAGQVAANPLGPEDFGLARQNAESLVVRDAGESAETIDSSLRGRTRAGARLRDRQHRGGSLDRNETARCSRGRHRPRRRSTRGLLLRLLERLRELAPA